MANTRMKLLAGAVVLGMAAMASAASAQTLVGGGATLPAVAYIGFSASDTSLRQFTPDSDSLFGSYSSQTGNPVTSYCQTGSGAGKNILAGVAGTSVQNACPGGATTPTGFGAGAVGRTDLAFPNFAASDSPLSQTDLANYTTGHTGTGSQPLQFPAVAGAIAISFNKAGVGSLNLTDDQICRVFSGQITDWSVLTGGAASGPITIVYRADGSGTSFSFTNHLAAVCGASNIGGGHFDTNQQYGPNIIGAVPASTPSSAFAQTALADLTSFASGVPSSVSLVGASGNPNVASAIADTDGALGYVETANTLVPGITFATVNGQDPTLDFGSNVSVTASFNKVVSGTLLANGQVQLADVSAPSSNCIAVVDPVSYSNPSSGYPIVAVSYLLGNATGNGTDAAHVRSLLGAPYNTAVQNGAETIGPNAGTGLAFLTVSNVTQAQINACVVN